MKAEEFLKRLHHLDEVFKLHDDAEYNERQLTQFAERYHESELKLLSIADVSGRSELLLDFLQWYNDHHPENYIPNSRLGNYLQEKSSNSH